jgi:hypothetical protein
VKVLVDDLWASKTTLHMRVTVSGDDYSWRRRFYEAIPFEDIPTEALIGLTGYLVTNAPTEEEYNIPLF